MYVLGAFNVVAAVMLLRAPQQLLPEGRTPCTLPELYIRMAVPAESLRLAK
jgi:hypothetical protein